MKTVYSEDMVENSKQYSCSCDLQKLKSGGLVKFKDTTIPEYAAHLLTRKVGLCRPKTELVLAKTDLVCKKDLISKGTIGLFMEELKFNLTCSKFEIDGIVSSEEFGRISYLLLLDRFEWPQLINIHGSVYLLDMEFTLPKFTGVKNEDEYSMSLHLNEMEANIQKINEVLEQRRDAKCAIKALKKVVSTMCDPTDIFNFEFALNRPDLDKYYNKSVSKMSSHLLRLLA
jgi:hypothetical protein